MTSAAAHLETSLEQLDPRFRPIAKAILDTAAERGLPLTVISTRRDPRVQAALYAQGRVQLADGSWVLDQDARTDIVTRARPGRSAHEHGLAIDCCPTVLLARKLWDTASPLWVAYGVIVRACGADWGGDKPKFKDRPHAQARHWLRMIAQLS